MTSRNISIGQNGNDGYHYGKFIVFEGIDCSGKSTQAKELKNWLESVQDRKVLLTREPGGTILAEKIRDLALSHHDERLFSKSEMLLMIAARFQHYHHIIKPAIHRGEIVICDRFIDSTIAYQGTGRRIGRDTVINIHEEIGLKIKPDLTILIDISAEESQKRMGKREKDRIECSDYGFICRARQAFLDEESFNRNTHFFDGERSIEDIKESIRTLVFNEFLEWM